MEEKMWESDEFDHKMLLFIAYIVDEKISTFDIHLYKDGRAESIKQVESIKQWEYRNNLDSLLSNCYARCLELFIKNNFVYESSWKHFGNPREYTLFQSLQDYLFNCPAEIIEKLQEVKEAHQEELPF